MPGTINDYTSKPYLSIIQGTLRQKVDKTTPGAKFREGETPKGEHYEKWELEYKDWAGKITSLRISESDYGESLRVDFEDAVLNINVESRYFTPFVKRIAGADLSQPVRIAPYDFVDDSGKRRTGINVFQGETKLSDPFYDATAKTTIPSYPKPDGDIKTYAKADWKLWFAKETRYLVGLVPSIAAKIPSPVVLPEEETPDGSIGFDAGNNEEVDISKVPF